MISHCHHKFAQDGEQVEFGHDDKHHLLDQIMGQQLTKKEGLKCLAFSYADMSIESFEHIVQHTNNFVNSSDFHHLLKDAHHTFITLVALKDTIRTGVKEAIETAKKEGKIEIRLISSDHLETAKAYAVDCGIVVKECFEYEN